MNVSIRIVALALMQLFCGGQPVLGFKYSYSDSLLTTAGGNRCMAKPIDFDRLSPDLVALSSRSARRL